MIEGSNFDPLLFAVLTVGFMGGAGWLTGQAVALTWRPLRQVLAACLLLGCGDRFLVFALFEGNLLSLAGFLVDSSVIVAFGACGWRVTRARRMVVQYPWLYERAGPFGWRRRAD